MKSLSVFLVSCIFVLLCGGCALKYENVSKYPEYEPLVNTYYSLSTNMLIYGVNSPPGYGKDINVYIVKPMNMRTSGPEILTEDILKPGAVIEVQGVRRSTNHLPGNPSIDAVVTVQSYEKSADVPIVIDLKYLQSTNYMRRLDH